MSNRAFAALAATVATLLVLIIASVAMPRDSTDPPNERSGLTLHTDHETGCQYLRVGSGGLTPRMGRDGKQLCK